MAKESREVLDDGRVIVTRSLSPSLRSIPTFGLWQFLMAERPDHGVVIHTDPEVMAECENGCYVTAEGEVIETCSAHSPCTMFYCIGCGKLLKFMDQAGDIHVGSLVRTQTEDEVAGETVKDWKVMPTVKRGIGCADCYTAYSKEAAAVEALNQANDNLYLVELALWRAEGCKPEYRPDVPKKRTAWLDLRDQCTEAKDAYLAHIAMLKDKGLLEKPRPKAAAKLPAFDPTANHHRMPICLAHHYRLGADGSCPFCRMKGQQG